MKQLLLFILFASTIFVSCKSNHSELADSKVSEMRTFIEKTYQNIDSTMKLDSFRFVRLDTITQQEKYMEMTEGLISEVQELNETGAKLIESYKNNKRMADLINDISSSTYSYYKDEADDDIKKISEQRDETQQKLKALDSLQVLTAKADSVKPVGYQAVCLYQIRRADMSVKKDTCYVLLNLEKNIVKKNDFLTSK